MYLAFFISSIVFFTLYIIFSLFLHKKNYGEKYNFKNHFPYELFRFKKKEQFNINILLFICLLFVFINNVIFAIKYKETLSIINCLICFFAVSAFIIVSIMPLNKLKEHILFFILSAILSIIISSINLLIEIRYWKIWLNNLYIIGIIFDSLIIIIGVLILFNPKVINLNMDTDQEGKLIRPKLIPLAISEWICFVLILLTQISSVIISIV